MEQNFKYKTDKEGLVALGDLHGNWSSIAEFCKNYQNFCIIQVGDFGLGFYHPIKESHRLKKLNKVLHDSNNELISIRGNHDNPKYFHNKWLEEEVFLSNDYTILEHGGKKIQLIGGGISIDRSERIIGRSWWDKEEVNFQPERVEKVDILITHVAPSNFPLQKADTNSNVVHYHGIESSQGGDLLGELLTETKTVQKISDLSECNLHIFGHYHHSLFFVDEITHRKYICLNIDEFREIK